MSLTAVTLPRIGEAPNKNVSHWWPPSYADACRHRLAKALRPSQPPIKWRWCVRYCTWRLFKEIQHPGWSCIETGAHSIRQRWTSGATCQAMTWWPAWVAKAITKTLNPSSDFSWIKKWNGSDTKTTQDTVMQQTRCRQHSWPYNCKRLRSKWGNLSPIAFDKKIGNSTTYWCVRKNLIPITVNDDYLKFPSRHWFKSHMTSWCL